MCVVDACMVCIEGGGVITALHHQITNLTHHHQIHQRDARAEERYAITSRTFAVKWMILMAAHSTTSHWEQLVHSCFQRRAEPRKTARHVSSANCGSFNATRATATARLMPRIHPSWCSCGDFKEFRGNVRLCFRPPTVALNECHRVAAAADIWTFCGRGHYSSDNLCRR